MSYEDCTSSVIGHVLCQKRRIPLLDMFCVKVGMFHVNGQFYTGAGAGRPH